MIRIIFVIIIIALSIQARANDFLPRYEYAYQWIEKNEESSLLVFDLLKNERDGTHFWLLEESIKFRYKSGDEYIRYTPDNIENYKKIAPKHSNHFFSIKNENYHIELGVFDDCGEVTCTQSMVKFTTPSSFEACTRDNISIPQSSCIYPLFEDWHVLYIKLSRLSEIAYE